jgi:hypothetical protein
MFLFHEIVARMERSAIRGKPTIRLISAAGEHDERPGFRYASSGLQGYGTA